MAVVRRGGARRTCEEDRLLLSLGEFKDDDAELMEWDRLRRLRLVRARARLAAVVSGDGGSPNMKNLMNTPMTMTTESWPRRNPSVNDTLKLFGIIVAKM